MIIIIVVVGNVASFCAFMCFMKTTEINFVLFRQIILAEKRNYV